MLVLVQNDDKTFSFDDITYAIFNRGSDKESDYFNYDYQLAKQNRQVDLTGFDTDMLRYIVTDSKDTIYDKMFRAQYTKENEVGFLKIPMEKLKRHRSQNFAPEGH